MPRINARLDLRRTIRRLGMDEAIEVHTFGTGARVQGRWEDPRPVTAAISASVQEADSETKLVLPEGLRTQDSIEVWSDSQIKPLSRRENRSPDRIVWNGAQYEVFEVQDWSPHALYWYALCYRVDE